MSPSVIPLGSAHASLQQWKADHVLVLVLMLNRIPYIKSIMALAAINVGEITSVAPFCLATAKFSS